MENLSECARLDSRDASPGAGQQGRQGPMVQAKKIAVYIVVVFILYTIINSPDRAADLVGVGFEGISSAAQGVGEFMTELVN
ncbi:conserved hypothetical protein [Streptomyces pristinaespiralis ATCC 25486]|uniref:Uncharacterized protein n=2 Tax=Streptomyces pristinaespiralis TaxID=38300 RepID=B5HJT6_STRE2|nr:conserved hypothetical protein [Streptomyces pristinaespiralis ATCC 25486]